MPIPKVTIALPPPGGVTADELASVMTTWTAPVNAPAGTVAVTVELPTVPVATPPPGWTVVVEATVPASPAAVPPGVGEPAGV